MAAVTATEVQDSTAGGQGQCSSDEVNLAPGALFGDDWPVLAANPEAVVISAMKKLFVPSTCVSDGHSLASPLARAVFSSQQGLL